MGTQGQCHSPTREAWGDSPSAISNLSVLKNVRWNEWSSALKGAEPRIAPAANGETPRSFFGDVSGLSQEVIGALPVAVYMTDAEGRLTFYNKAAVALWGCFPELGKRKFCGSWKLYWPDGTPLPHNECPMAMALRQRRSIPGMEVYAERPDGTRIPFIPYPTPLFDASGRLTGAVNMLVDISERKRAEAALEERNAQFELASSIALIGSYSYDYHTKILQLSRACAAIYGLPEGVREITQEDWRARVHPDDLPRIDATCRQALAQRQAELVLEFRIIRSGGKDRWIEARILVSYDDAGRAVQMIGANIDVTERKQTAQDLAERTVQLALAERAARVGSYAYDLDSETSDLCAIHGFPNGTTEIARSKCLAGVHREDIDRVRHGLSSRNGSPEYNVEYRIVGSDGEVRWVGTRGRDGSAAGIGVSIDVSERNELKRLVARTHRNRCTRWAPLSEGSCHKSASAPWATWTCSGLPAVCLIVTQCRLFLAQPTLGPSGTTASYLHLSYRVRK